MGLILFLLLLGVPLLEIAVFIAVGERIGLWPTLGLVVVTAVAGAALLRHQGLTVLDEARAALDREEFPIAQVFDGVCLLVAGALLLTPGFVTDTLGLLLFVKPLRAWARLAAWRYLSRHGEVHVWGEGEGPGGPPGGGPTVIEGEYRDVTPDEERRPGGREPERHGDRSGPPRA